jgi:sucrose-6-phosphate hydrolase SacC (GH32 family)
MWYTGGVNWENNNGVLKHYYTIKHANSDDGIHWEASPEVCIPFQYETEYAIARPSVTKLGDTYHMWYTYRETPTIHTYRIGYATSADGLAWTRKDDEAGIDVSPEGWASEMVGYPHVFEHNGVWFLMYNGNGYGKTGFGYATHDGPIR